MALISTQEGYTFFSFGDSFQLKLIVVRDEATRVGNPFESRPWYLSFELFSAGIFEVLHKNRKTHSGLVASLMA